MTTNGSVDVVNEDAPSANASDTSGSGSDSGSSGTVKPLDGIDLGGSKPLSVTDVTGVLKNNAGVQKMIDNAQKFPSSK